MIEVDGLTVATREGHTVLRDVSLAIPKGQIHAVVGESGSGKTTLGLNLLGHVRTGLRHEAGSVHVGGQEPLAIRGRALRRYRRNVISWMSQDPAQSLSPHLTVRELLQEAHPAPLNNEALVMLLANVGLESVTEILSRRADELSGGQRRRIAILRALITDPEVLILDEPTAGLDARAIEDLLQLLREMHEKRALTMVMISHDVDVVDRFTDAVTVLDEGRVIESGAPEDLRRDPRSRWAQLRCASSLLHDKVAARETPAQGIPALELRDVTVHTVTGEVVAERLSLSVTPGAGASVVGPSGAGKSTLVRTILGAHPLSDGAVLLQDNHLPARLRDRSPDQRRAIQLISQDPIRSLNPAVRIGAQIERAIRRAHPTWSRAAIAVRLAELLGNVGLDQNIMSRLPRSVSGGQAQRVAIARALAHEPLVLLCDEATSSLDPTVQQEVLRLLDRLTREQELALIVVTHDARVAEFLCQAHYRVGPGAQAARKDHS